MRVQAATRRRSDWLLKLKGFLQDSRVETSSAVHRNQRWGLSYGLDETDKGAGTDHLRNCLQTKGLPTSDLTPTLDLCNEECQ